MIGGEPRNDEVIGVVKDMVFGGSRFISGDGVDTMRIKQGG
jgi:hypothetical protein